jgi:outer membrane receptor protein involved in Fe transport
MKNANTLRLKLTAIAVAGAFATPITALAEEQINKTKKIEVISTTPLPGIGLALDKVPASVQVVDGEEMQNQQSLTIADFMSNNLVGVNVNEVQNNPFQPNINFRGFTASPLLGTPQGLSIFYDGVRINEPFGDVVNWDLVPLNAIANMNLIPGSNPVFGLNTLGGAISLQTKSGRTHQGGAIEASAGSWARRSASAEYGGVADNNVDYFFALNTFDENGWRDYSPSEVHQFFGKLGWQNDSTDINVSLTAADTNLVGNGYVQKEFLDDLEYDAINTKPDQTKNNLWFLNANMSHYFNDTTMLSANAYYRNARTKTLNGDVNDEVDEAAFDPDCMNAADPDEACGGALNRTKSDRDAYGFTAQLTFDNSLFGKKNQLTTGVGYDYGKTNFKQTTEFGNINSQRGVDGIGAFSEIEDDLGPASLKGVTKTWSLYATDTLSLNDITHLTLSGRYNYTKVDNDDKFDGLYTDPNSSLSGNHSFHRFNPAIGLVVNPSKALSVFASYNEGSRAPTSIELGCANPARPCNLPNALAGDPPLDQVVSKTYEAGIRNQLTERLGLSASIYRTQNTDDIQFISARNNGAGFFDNVGKTRRVGMDIGLNGEFEKFKWFAGYSYVRATYESSFTVVSETNSTANGDDEIQVRPGDEIPGIPNHQFKFRGEYQATPNWSVGTNVVAFSDQYSQGNQNNKHQGAGAKTSGYTIVNLDTRYRFNNSGWQLFGKVNNIFNKEYFTGGLLGENFFDENGQFNDGEDEASALVSPGAPRAAWVGVRYEFGGRKSTPAYDFD